MMGLKVSDFDIITLKQFKVMQKKYWERMKLEKEIDSYAGYNAIVNAFKGKNEKYKNLWEDPDKQEITEQTIKEFNEETEALLDW